MDTEEGLIPQPIGEAGRPGRGGYNFETQLAWNTKAFKKLKVSFCVRSSSSQAKLSTRALFTNKLKRNSTPAKLTPANPWMQ